MITGDYLKTAQAIARNIHILNPDGSQDKDAVDCNDLRPGGEYLREALRAAAHLMSGGLRGWLFPLSPLPPPEPPRVHKQIFIVASPGSHILSACLLASVFF